MQLSSIVSSSLELRKYIETLNIGADHLLLLHLKLRLASFSYLLHDSRRKPTPVRHLTS